MAWLPFQKYYIEDVHSCRKIGGEETEDNPFTKGPSANGHK